MILKQYKGFEWTQIGPCRLILGDCLKVLPLLSQAVNSIIADPPYGIDFQSNVRLATPKMKKIANDETPFVDWIAPAFNAMIDCSSISIFYRWDVQDDFIGALSKTHLNVKSQVVWWKPGGGIGDLDASFAPEHELVLFSTKGKFGFPNGRPMSVVRCEKVPPGALVHPNQKPVILIEKFVKWTTRQNDMVLDPFMGSGTTGEACVRMGRKFIGIELDREHFETACKRIECALYEHKNSLAPVLQRSAPMTLGVVASKRRKSK